MEKNQPYESPLFKIFPVENNKVTPYVPSESPNVRRRRDKSVQSVQVEGIKTQKKLHFFLLFNFLIKVLNTLRLRTKFRPLKSDNEDKMKFLNDPVYFPKKKQSYFSIRKYAEKNVLLINIIYKLIDFFARFLKGNFMNCCSKQQIKRFLK